MWTRTRVSSFGSSATRILAPVLPAGATGWVFATSANAGWSITRGLEPVWLAEVLVDSSRTLWKGILQGMTADELFLLTFEDLEERVALGRGEYDALISAWLLRKLLLDEQPFVHRANRSRRLKLKFRMYDDQPPEGIEGWGPGYFLWPDPENQSGRPTVELTLDQFLSRPTLVAFGHIITVRDLIKFMANYEGAVHTTVPNDEKTKALWDTRWGETRVGPEGQYGGCIHELIAIGRIVLDGLDDLRTQVEGETWPPHRGASTRGLRRERDPRRRGAP
jgi:hypothetical protein